ncbi:MAG: hypothetical protein ACM3SW_18725 [Actinomycetota bacterium]
MRTRIQISLAALVLLLASSLGSAQAHKATKAHTAKKTTTLTGQVSDTMCGNKHMMEGKSAAECTRECVKGGSDYALMVGKKMYTLKGNAAELDKYAGERVTVKGSLTGSTLTAESITPAKTAKTAKKAKSAKKGS